MKKILIGYIIDGKKSGIDKYLLNLLNAVKEKDCKIDFLTNTIDVELKEYLEQYDSDLYEIPSLKHPIKQLKAIKQIIKQNEYDVAYFNISEAFNCIGLLASYLCKVPKRIIHSHSSGCDSASAFKFIKIFMHRFAKLFLPIWANTFVTCSDKAAEWMYTKKIIESNKVELILNGIDTQKFLYSEEKRIFVREKMNWNNKTILMHVGNFLYVKNHVFLVDLVEKLKDKNYRMVFVGDGPLREEIQASIQEKGLNEYVEFLGVRKDVADLLQGSDFFLLPSHFEGLPLTAVEAQVSGNVCLVSEKITKDVKLCNSCIHLPIESVDPWITAIKSYENHTKEEFRNTSGKIIDVYEQVMIFEKLFGMSESV